ncbi:MAG: PfkB family carbohydrate kinase, partial [Treponema sp.]|nr:PfkB family carbohydrate kinase [Treponema sp.]
EDERAAFFKEELAKAGVASFLCKAPGGTGLFLVIRAGGTTRIAASPGASLALSLGDLPPGLVARARAVVLDGYMLDRLPLVHGILDLADRRRLPVVLDVASPDLAGEQARAILGYTLRSRLILFMNAAESIAFWQAIASLGESPPPEGDDREGFVLQTVCPALKPLTEKGPFPIIVIKLGEKGAVVLSGGKLYRAETRKAEPKDTVGAGDAFCAAFMSAWLRGFDLPECADLSNKVARKVLAVHGTGVGREALAPFAELLGSKNGPPSFG